MTTHPHAPVELLYSTLGGDPDLGEIVDLFVAEMPQRVADILNLLDGARWGQLGRAAHQLKGAAGSYGFGPISPAAARVEEAVRQGLPEEPIRAAVDELVDLCHRARGGTPDGAGEN
jgi:HPt (histidine-containing phosphotransfer) domain-containing protein